VEGSGYQRAIDNSGVGGRMGDPDIARAKAREIKSRYAAEDSGRQTISAYFARWGQY